jgi:hypothetical protein
MPELQVLMRRGFAAGERLARLRSNRPGKRQVRIRNGSRQLSHYFYAVMRRFAWQTVFLKSNFYGISNPRAPAIPTASRCGLEDVMMIMRQQVTIW